jgi:hypothetical protein
MDPLTLIMGAIVAGIIVGSQSVAEQAVKDAYLGLKSLIKNKFGSDSEVVDTIQGLERKPESQGRRETLKEELNAVKAGQDAEIVKTAQKLLDLIEKMPDGEKHLQQAIGNYIAQADRGSTATVTVTQSPNKEE